jgi:plasmid stability protein
MRQMITRLDDELHARLKAQAAAENRSVNDLVIGVLAAALDGTTSRWAVRERARATGRLVVPEPPPDRPHHQDAVDATRGFGDAVSSALERERSAR